MRSSISQLYQLSLPSLHSIILIATLFSLFLPSIHSVNPIPYQLSYSDSVGKVTAVDVAVTELTDALAYYSFATWGQKRTTVVAVNDLTTGYAMFYDQSISKVDHTESDILDAQIIESAVDEDGYGKSLDVGYSLLTKDIIAVGAPPAATSGKVYLYRRTPNTKSLLAVLVPDSGINTVFDNFGFAVSLDLHDPTTLAVGANRRQMTYLGIDYTDTGAVYMFEATSTGSGWTQSQRLLPKSPADDLLFGSVVRLNGHSLVVTSPGNCEVAIFTQEQVPRPPRSVFTEPLENHQQQKKLNSVYSSEYKFDPRFDIVQPILPQWSQTQSLTMSGCDTTLEDTLAASIYEDTIVIGHPYYGTGGSLDTGVVVILKRQSPDRWTQHQILRKSTPVVDDYFGSVVTLYEDLLAVTAKTDDFENDGEVYIFQRSSDQWTQISALTGIVDGSNFGTYISISGTDIAVGGLDLAQTSPYIWYFTADESWNCIIVSIADQFGDGWGGADLVITSPDGNAERYAPKCSAAVYQNNYFRWCPDQPGRQSDKPHEDYTIEIPKALEYPFHWEMHWSVYMEATGDTLIGTAASKMKFRWDTNDYVFSIVEGKLLFDNGTCETCPLRPTPKPTPFPKMSPLNAENVELVDHRSLHKAGPHPTPRPTISAYPTLSASDYGVDWQYMSLVDPATAAPKGWWEKENEGAKYYFSTSDGKHLLGEGQLCVSGYGEDFPCWQEFPPESDTYILRVGGAMFDDHASVFWKFCNHYGAAQDQLVFKVNHNDWDGTTAVYGCQPLYTFDQAEYCSNFVTATVRLNGLLVVPGVYTLTSVDIRALETALANIFHSSYHVDAHAIIHGQASEGVVVQFGVNIPMSSLGIDAHSSTAFSLAYTTADSKLYAAVQSHLFFGYLSDALNGIHDQSMLGQAMSSNSKFAIAIVETYEGPEVKFLYDGKELTDYEDDFPIVGNYNYDTDTSESSKISSLDAIIEQYGGYLKPLIGVVGVCVLLLAAFLVKLRTVSSTVDLVAQSSQESNVAYKELDTTTSQPLKGTNNSTSTVKVSQKSKDRQTQKAQNPSTSVSVCTFSSSSEDDSDVSMSSSSDEDVDEEIGTTNSRRKPIDSSGSASTGTKMSKYVNTRRK